MDCSLKYSEIITCEESTSLQKLIERPAKKPRMVFRKSRVLARVQELLPRLQEEEKKLKSGKSDINVENCAENEPYIEMSAVGIVKEPESESDPKMMILDESEIKGLSSDSESEDEIDDKTVKEKKLIVDISEQTLTVEDVPSIEKEKVTLVNEGEVPSVEMEILETVKPLKGISVEMPLKEVSNVC